jgi:putative membrane protein
MMWDMMGGMWGMMPVVLLFWVVLLAGIAVLLWWVLARRPGERRDSALDILRERYARGELNREEFESRRRDLGG